MILACSCKHDFQDERHGAGMRVHNRIPKQQGPDGWRCTICKTDKEGKGDAKTAKKK